MSAFEKCLVQCPGDSKHLTYISAYHHSHSTSRDDVGSFSRNSPCLQENIFTYTCTKRDVILCNLLFSLNNNLGVSVLMYLDYQHSFKIMGSVSLNGCTIIYMTKGERLKYMITYLFRGLIFENICNHIWIIQTSFFWHLQIIINLTHVVYQQCCWETDWNLCGPDWTCLMGPAQNSVCCYTYSRLIWNRTEC